MLSAKSVSQKYFCHSVYSITVKYSAYGINHQSIMPYVTQKFSVTQLKQFKRAETTTNPHAAKQEPDGRVTVRRDPNAGKVIVVDAILEELPSAVLMNIDTSGQSIMDVTLHHSWVGSRFHLKTSNPIVVDVVIVKITLWQSSTKILTTIDLGPDLKNILRFVLRLS